MSLSEIHNYYEDLVENYIDALELNQTRSLCLMKSVRRWRRRLSMQ